MEACACDLGPGNSGVPSCLQVMGVARKKIFIPKYDSEGNLNYIDLAIPITQAILDDHVNDPDPSKRWYPYQVIKNYTPELAENITETAADGSQAFVQDGIRTMVWQIWDKPDPVLLGKLERTRCVDMGEITIDKNGSIIGGHQDGTKLYPRWIDMGSWAPTMEIPIDTTTQKILMRYNYTREQSDSQMRMILSSEYTGNIFGLKGLQDVNMTTKDIIATSFTGVLKTEFGSAIAKQPVVGLDPSDFALYNETDSAPVVIVSAPEIAPGEYDFTFASQAGDTLRLTPTKDGYDFTAVIATDVELP